MILAGIECIIKGEVKVVLGIPVKTQNTNLGQPACPYQCTTF